MREITLEQVIEQINKDLEHDKRMMEYYDQDTKEYLFHVGRVDGLTSVRWKLQEILRNSK